MNHEQLHTLAQMQAFLDGTGSADMVRIIKLADEEYRLKSRDILVYLFRWRLNQKASGSIVEEEESG